ncbi:hypothetical protein SBV1_3650003 [Verrucomicrobia bacterium]|nr:hypothetical protein SBV1_3650003 [Verrucomicrobiota bacterium]
MPSQPGTSNLFPPRGGSPPDHYLTAYSDGGARGNPGPAGYGVVIQDQAGKKIASLSEYLGHQTNNFAEYQGEERGAQRPARPRQRTDCPARLVFYRPRPPRP